MPPWTTLYVNVFWVALACFLPASLLLGDRALRSASSWYGLCGAVAWLGRHKLSHAHFEPIEATSDLVLMVAFIRLAAINRDRWLIVAAALQTITCLGHLAAVTYRPTRLAYALMTGVGGYPILVTLSVALSIQIRHHRKKRRAAVIADLSWRTSLPQGVRTILARLRLD